jgi:YkoY family integral membrane protein
VLLSSVLIEFWYFKLVGGIYLIYLAVSHFASVFSGRGHDHDQASETDEDGRLIEPKQFGRGFWGTVISVELADIAFSIDSILAAVAMADDLPDRLGNNWKLAVVYVGGILGILTMRFVAGYFILLLDRFKGLANGAYCLVAWIGVKLMSGGLADHHVIPHEMPAWLFWSVMILIAAGSFLASPRQSPSKEADVDRNSGVGKEATKESVKPV